MWFCLQRDKKEKDMQCMKDIQEAAYAYIYFFHIYKTVAGNASLLQRRSRIRIRVPAWRRWRRRCLFAEQLLLTGTLILPSRRRPPPPNLLKENSFMWQRGRRKNPHPSILFITTKTASSDGNIHPSSSNSREKKQRICRDDGIYSVRGRCSLSSSVFYM